MHIKLIAATLIILACAAQSGCAILRPTTSSQPELSPAAKLLFYNRALLRASPSGRYTMLVTARNAFQEHSTAAKAARLALAYGQPGFKGYSPENGRQYAQKALTLNAELWGPAATAYLKQFAALCADNAHVRNQLDNAHEQNRHIKQQLSQTRQKIQALTRLESELN